MNFGSSVDKKDIGSGYVLLLQPIIALPQWASAHNGKAASGAFFQLRRGVGGGSIRAKRRALCGGVFRDDAAKHARPRNDAGRCR